jgi:hypothetical protein
MMYRPAPAVSTADVAGEITLMEPHRGVYFGLEGPGARIWHLLPATLDGIVAQLTAEFEVDDATCRHDVAELLDQLVATGLVVCEPA